MKKTLMTLALAFTTLTTVASVSAIWPEDTQINSNDGRLALTPSKVVAPRVLHHEIGQVVWVSFVVAEDGSTMNVVPMPKEGTSRHLAERVVSAVNAWEFEPVMGANGQAQTVTIEMPITIGGMTSRI